MIEGKSVLAIIPAREGSKRVPMKNLTLFRGKPLIQWAIEHAKSSKYVDRTVVVSDSAAILLHAIAPVERMWEPDWLASDSGTSEAVIACCLYCQKELPDYFVLLQPTSPLRTAEDIDTCIERAVKHTGQCISYNEYGKRNGAVYVSDAKKFLSTLSLSDPKFGADVYQMSNSRSLDIDYPQDFDTKADS